MRLTIHVDDPSDAPFAVKGIKAAITGGHDDVLYAFGLRNTVTVHVKKTKSGGFSARVIAPPQDGSAR